MPSALRMRANPFAALIFMGRIRLFGLGLVEGDDQRLEIRDLDQIADLHALQVLGVLDLDRLLTALRTFQRHPLRLGVDLDDLADDGDLPANHPGRIVSGLGAGARFGHRRAGRRAPGGTELDGHRFEIRPDHRIADLDGLELRGVLHVERDRATAWALERDRLVLLVDGGDGSPNPYDGALGLAGPRRGRAPPRLGVVRSDDRHGQQQAHRHQNHPHLHTFSSRELEWAALSGATPGTRLGSSTRECLTEWDESPTGADLPGVPR